MKKIYAFVHTHWDREWYQPFETFRVYLVSVLRQILDELETGKLSKFYLDGQAVILDDALEIAPELAPRIAALMSRGELAAGPWYVLPDEMLVCGESLIRNLKMGISCVRKFGAPSLVGYSPDTFGHSQDLPRILCGFGIRSAFVWRGVPALQRGPAFWWQSPDGSKVLSYHLSRGYYQTSLIEKTQSDDLNLALDSYVIELEQFANDRRQWDNSRHLDNAPDALLYPIGGDHTAPPRGLTDVLKELNLKLAAKKLEIGPIQLSEFADTLERQAGASAAQVGLIAGELRDNSASKQYGNAFLLPGVLSTRLYLKRANREAERRMFRFVEPLLSLLAIRDINEFPQAELSHALRLLLKNHPHDSICGCSVDSVHDEMLTRFARVHQVLDPVLDAARGSLSGLPDNSPLSPEDPAADLKCLRVLNPGGRSFTGVVPFQWYEEQAVLKLAADKGDSTPGFASGSGNGAVSTGIPGRATHGVAPTDLDSGGGDARRRSALQVLECESVDQLFAGWGRVPYYKMVEQNRGYIWVEDVPAFGEQNLSWPPPESDKFPIVKASGKTLDNGTLKVTVAAKGQIKVVWTRADATQSTYELSHSLRDTADGGDTYNYDPIHGDIPVEAKLLSVVPGKTGPLLSSLVLTYEMKIPEDLLELKAITSPRKNTAAAKAMVPALPTSFKRSTNKIVHQIRTEIILKRASRILEFETSFVNQSAGHRLEALISTGAPVHHTFSENHFSLVARNHQSKTRRKAKLPVDIGDEYPCDRFPAQRFFAANGQLILNKGLPEYGVDGESITITLLRSVSLLSRGRMQSRGGGAGPHVAAAGAECKGINQTSYAWSPLSLFQKRKIAADSLDTEIILEAYDLAEEYEQEMFCAFSNEDDTATHSLLYALDSRVRLLGAYISQDCNELYVRLQNMSTEFLSSKIIVDFEFQSAHLCRLDQEVGEEVFLYREYIQTTESDQGPSRDVCALEINFGVNELKTMKLHLKNIALVRVPSARAKIKRSRNSQTG